MPGVQFGTQIDMNGFLITELAPGVAGTDAVNVNQLTAAAPRSFRVLVGDGAASTFQINHNFNLPTKEDFILSVKKVSTGQAYMVEVVGVTVNQASVTFGNVPTLNEFRVSVVPTA